MAITSCWPGSAWPAPGRANHARDGDEARAIGHLDDVDTGFAGRLDGPVHAPARAETAEAREAEAAGIEAAQHVASAVHMDEEERHALGARPLQGDEASADMLERRPETPAEKIDIVVEGLGGGVETLVGHDAGAGEIVGQLNGKEAARLPLKARLVRDVVQKLVPAEERQLMGELEDALFRRQRVGEQHAPAVAVVAADQVVHDVRGHDADLDAVRVREHGAQPLVKAIGIEARVGPGPLGSLFQFGEVGEPGPG